MATPWVSGQPLTASQADDARAQAHLGRYIALVAGPPLRGDARAQAAARLGEMLYWNVWEALGEDAAARTRRWSEAAALWESRHRARTYGDGRLAPHEWLRTKSGLLLKIGSGGHEADHTLVGRQPVSWDVAGAMVEWGLSEDAARPLLKAYQGAGGDLVSGSVLAFYRLAYAAFRMGQCAISVGMASHDPQEHARLRAAMEHYRAELGRLLEG